MKKTYQAPATVVMNVELQQMIADSFTSTGGNGQTFNSDATGKGLSRQGGAWDDDEE